MWGDEDDAPSRPQIGQPISRRKLVLFVSIGAGMGLMTGLLRELALVLRSGAPFNAWWPIVGALVGGVVMLVPRWPWTAMTLGWGAVAGVTGGMLVAIARGVAPLAPGTPPSVGIAYFGGGALAGVLFAIAYEIHYALQQRRAKRQGGPTDAK